MDTSNGGTPVMRWVRLEQGPTRPGDGEFNLWWDNYTPEGGGSAAAGIVKYSIDGATEQTAVLNSCTAIGIGETSRFPLRHRKAMPASTRVSGVFASPQTGTILRMTHW